MTFVWFHLRPSVWLFYVYIPRFLAVSGGQSETLVGCSKENYRLSPWLTGSSPSSPVCTIWVLSYIASFALMISVTRKMTVKTSNVSKSLQYWQDVGISSISVLFLNYSGGFCACIPSSFRGACKTEPTVCSFSGALYRPCRTRNGNFDQILSFGDPIPTPSAVVEWCAKVDLWCACLCQMSSWLVICVACVGRLATNWTMF